MLLLTSKKNTNELLTNWWQDICPKKSALQSQDFLEGTFVADLKFLLESYIPQFNAVPIAAMSMLSCPYCESGARNWFWIWANQSRLLSVLILKTGLFESANELFVSTIHFELFCSVCCGLWKTSHGLDWVGKAEISQHGRALKLNLCAAKWEGSWLPLLQEPGSNWHIL